jgi:hypothetical protein
MDNFRALEDNAGADFSGDDEPAMEAPPAIGVDERRMHVRAYNYWVSLLDGRPYPSIEDVDPETLEDFGPHSVLLDFSTGSDNPAVVFIGRALREECQLDTGIRFISDVPSRSLLSRLTDHYLQIIANCAPIGFEAEFVSQRGLNTLYRGILMPLSSDGDTIDFIYGVINWKEVVDQDTSAEIARQVDRTVDAAPAAEPSPIWEDGPHTEEPAEFVPGNVAGGAGDYAPYDDDEEAEQPSLPLGGDAGLADRLCLARETAETVKNADARSRSALYRALGDAYDFALAAEAAPEDYAEILDDAGLKAQDRAPMTPVVKLIFGIEYDKTRLTEFAAALSYGRREAVPQGGLAGFLGSFEGGLKGIVAAERRARRPAARPDAGAAAADELRQAAPIGYVNIPAGDEEFVLLLARREPDGTVAIVAPVAHDQALLDRAIRKVQV